MKSVEFKEVNVRLGEKHGKSIKLAKKVYSHLEQGSETDKQSINGSTIVFRSIDDEKVLSLPHRENLIDERWAGTWFDECTEINHQMISKLQSPKRPSKSFLYYSKQESTDLINKHQTPNTMKKEIIGYRLKEEKYAKAVESITGLIFLGKDWIFKRTINSGTIPHERLEASEVLDIWFSPVYKESATLTEGKWMKSPQGGFYCPYEVQKDAIYAYGINPKGIWLADCRIIRKDCEGDIPATDKEVEEALIEEAKKRGFKNGNYKCLSIPLTTIEVKNEDKFFIKYDNSLWQGKRTHGNCVFKDGKWAEIIEEDKKETLSEYLTRRLKEDKTLKDLSLEDLLKLQEKVCQEISIRVNNKL